MFRRAIHASAKVLAGVGTVQLGAAGVALTDKQLGKKPDWYQTAVRSLEESIDKTNKYGFIESAEVLDSAEETFTRVVDLDNPHVLWRLARVLAEKAEYIHDHHKQAETLKKAVELAQKAVQLEGAQGISGAHKWLAIAQYRLLHADKKAVKDVGKVKEQIWAHFKKAADLAPNDPYAQHFLGVAYFERKEYKEALAAFKKAHELKPACPQNLFYLGETYRLTKAKTEAVETLKKALVAQAKNKFDRKAKSDAKRVLLVNLKQKPEDILPADD